MAHMTHFSVLAPHVQPLKFCYCSFSDTSCLLAYSPSSSFFDPWSRGCFEGVRIRKVCGYISPLFAKRRVDVVCSSRGWISLQRNLWHHGILDDSRRGFVFPGFLSTCAPAIIPGFLSTSALLVTSTTEGDETKKMMKKRKDYALLTLCAQIVMAYSPLLRLVCKNWPSIMHQLSAVGRHGFLVPDAYETKLSHDSSSPSFHWKTLAFGLMLGVLMAKIFSNNSMEIGSLIDASFGICLLYSALFFIGCMARTAFSIGVQISNGGISLWCRNCFVSLLHVSCSILTRMMSFATSIFGHSVSSKRRK